MRVRCSHEHLTWSSCSALTDSHHSSFSPTNPCTKHDSGHQASAQCLLAKSYPLEWEKRAFDSLPRSALESVPGLLGVFALWTYLGEFPPWLLCPQWNDSLVTQPTQMTRVRVCWHEELLAGCAPRRSCGEGSCFAEDKGSQGLPHLPA